MKRRKCNSESIGIDSDDLVDTNSAVKNNQETIRVEIFIPNGEYNSIVHVKTFLNDKVENIINGISQNITLLDQTPKLYLRKATINNKFEKSVHINLTKSFLENNIEIGDFIELRTSSDQTKLLNNSLNQSTISNYENDEMNNNKQIRLNHTKNSIDKHYDNDNDDDEIIEVICKTYITDIHGQIYNKVYAKVYISDTLSKLMADVATLWEGKSGLKFKSGRTVLSSDKTYDDCGLLNGSEITVSGGGR
jgi:hypothetical protein